jgi:flagellar hook-associated protein FlgK
MARTKEAKVVIPSIDNKFDRLESFVNRANKEFVQVHLLVSTVNTMIRVIEDLQEKIKVLEAKK